MSTHSEIGYQSKGKFIGITTYWNGYPSDTLPTLKFFLQYFGYDAFLKDIKKHYRVGEEEDELSGGCSAIEITLDSLKNKSLTSTKSWQKGGTDEGIEFQYTVYRDRIEYNDWLHPGEDNEKEVERVMKYIVPINKSPLRRKIVKSLFNLDADDFSKENARLI